MRSKIKVIVSVFSLLALFALSGAVGLSPLTPSATQSISKTANNAVLPLPQSDLSPVGSKAFAFVSNFESKTLEGWKSILGSSPSVVTLPSYSGEPSLKSSAASQDQVDYANKGFARGQSSLSFQVAMKAASGTSGYIGLHAGNYSLVAVVGVRNGKVVAGPSLSSLTTIESIPTGTAYPSGWVYIISDLAFSGKSSTMQVFVDQTEQVSGQVTVPNAGNYQGALIETTKGTVYYTNVIFTTFQIANVVPGYHPMQGYGGRVASANGFVRLLPAYSNLTATMTLNSFSVPESDILSFQINAQNYTAATQSSCVGFFQIGLFLDSSKGYVDPWYVPDGNCIPYSFPQGSTLQIPAGEQVILSIVFEKSSHQILFQEVYPQIGKTLSQTIPYSGGAFYSAYTQMEFQPSSNYPISEYKLKGSIFGLQITLTGGSKEYLPANYMMPFNLDAPTSWDVHYYVSKTAGYDELTK